MTPAILVVDDSQDKVRAIAAALETVSGVDVAAIRYCGDVATALRELASQRFDVVIIDVVIPMRLNEAPSPDGGIVLLREIIRGERIILPTHIVGLTSFEEVFERVSTEFVSNAVTLLYFSPTETTWEEALRARVQHVIASNNQNVPAGAYGCDVAILCALETPELQAVRRLPWKWREITVPNDHTIYYEGSFVVGRVARRCIATATPRMGLPAAAVLATKLIYTFRPRLLVHCGITAGVPEKASFGDVIVANPVWDHGSGKWKRTEKKLRFHPSPYQIPLAPTIRERFRQLADDASTLATIKSEWPADAPATPINLRIAPMASGAAVIGDESVRDQVEEQHRKVAAIEMETYAVFESAQECSQPRPDVFAVKAVVDYADGGKNDAYHGYGAYVAAQIVRLYCERFALTG